MPLTNPASTPGASWRRFKSGLLYGPEGASISTSAPGIGTMRCGPFLVGERASFDRMYVLITSAVANCVARLGIYRDGGNYPGSLLFECSGTIDGNSATEQFLAIPSEFQSLAPGLWWLAYVNQVANATVQAVAGPVVLGVATGNIGQAANTYQETGVTAALPATFSGTVAGSAAMPRVMLRVA